MKSKNILCIATMVFVAMLFVTCQNEKPVTYHKKVDLNRMVDSISKINAQFDSSKFRILPSETIPTAIACSLINEFESSSNYGIPTSWLFDKDDIDDLLKSPNQQIAGLRFYSALNAQFDNTNIDAMTFIAVPVVSASGSLNDYLGYRFYEFAQLCPPYCKSGQNGTITERNTIPDYTIPKAIYIPKDKLEQALSDNSVTHLKLISILKNNKLDLSIVGTNGASNHEEIGTIQTGIAIPCPDTCSQSPAFCE